jgi:hypothetical protein
MRALNSITIAADRNSATLGGGVKSKEILDYLWAREKQTGKFAAMPSESQVISMNFANTPARLSTALPNRPHGRRPPY